MVESEQLNAVLAEWLQQLDRGPETQLDLVALHYLFKAWQSKTPDQNKSAIDYVLKGKTFVSLFSHLVNQASNRLDPTLLERLEHNTHRGAYHRLDHLMRSSVDNMNHPSSSDDSADPDDSALQTSFRHLIEHAFDPPTPQTEPADIERETLDDDYANLLVRSSFALPFQGPAVDLLLTHIQVHELGIQRTAELRRARIQKAVAQTPGSMLAVIDHATHQNEVDMQDATRALAFDAVSTPAHEDSVSFGKDSAVASSVPCHEQAAEGDEVEMQRQHHASDGSSASAIDSSPSSRSHDSAAATVSHRPHNLATVTSEHAAASKKAPVNVDLYYAKVLPIIQSSGFGKSKLCIHLSAAQPGMLVCLRPEPKVSVSFPPQDASVYDYFEKCYTKYFLETDKNKHSVEDSNMIHTTVTSFLAAYCFELHLILSELMRISRCFSSALDPVDTSTPSTSSGADVSGHNIHMCWNTVVFSLAVSLYAKPDFLAALELEPPHRLCPHSRLGLHGLLGSHAPHSTHVEDDLLSHQDRTFVQSLLKQRAREDLLKRICTRAETYLTKYKPNADPEDYKTPLHRFLSPALSRLEGLVPVGQEPPAIFFLALDECNTFSQILPHLRRVWNAAKPKRTWLLLIDTNSRIAPLIGREAREASKRTMKKQSRLVEPFVDMPLDVKFTPEHRLQVYRQILNRTFTLRGLNQLLPKLGRPLWNDALYSHSDHVIQPENIFVKLVRPDTWKWPDQPSDSDIDNPRSANFQNIMAILNQRVALEHSYMASRSPWKMFARGQVSRHLRFLCDYHQDTDVVNTHVPSEPALSIAVTWSFRHDPEQTATKWSLAVCTIASAHSSIGLNVGLQGEEGVRVLCSIAADLAASARYRAQLTETPPDYTSLMGVISLSEWLDCLIGSSDATSDSKFRAWCRRQWLNFKHVADLENQIKSGASVPIDMLGEFWMRHAAIRGVTEQCGWDLLLPIYECDKGPPVGDEPFLMHKLSYVVLQVKNCASRLTAPDMIGPSLPDLEVASQSMVSLELFLDLGDAGSTKRWSQRKHQYHSRQTVHRVNVSGHGIETFPLLAQLDAKAQDKVPVILSLPTSGEDDFGIDKTNHVRARCQPTSGQADFGTDKANYVRAHCQEPLLSYLRKAQTVKDGKLNPTTCIPDTTALTSSMSEGQRRSKRLREDSISTQNRTDS